MGTTNVSAWGHEVPATLYQLDLGEQRNIGTIEILRNSLGKEELVQVAAEDFLTLLNLSQG